MTKTSSKTPTIKKPSTFDFDLICLGSGSAGTVAANISRQAGYRVAIVEADLIGGECPNFGCVPTKALLQATTSLTRAAQAKLYGLEADNLRLDYAKAHQYKDRAIANTEAHQGDKALTNLGISVIRGRARFITPWVIAVGDQRLRGSKFLIATGALPAIPPIDGLDQVPYLTAREALDLPQPPQSLLIVGGGAIGCEMAEFFRTFKTRVQLVEATERLLPAEDPEVSQVVNRVFTNKGIQVHLSSKAAEVRPAGTQIEVKLNHGENSQRVVVDQILLATGKRPNIADLGLEAAKVATKGGRLVLNDRMQTSQSHIFAAGDVAGPHCFTHMAIYQSQVAAHNLWNRGKRRVSYRVVPRCIFLDPEVAAVGPTESQLQQQKIKYRKAITPISAVGRSNTSHQRTGLVKVLANPKGRLLGGSIIAPRAGEMIHELAVGVRANLTAKDLADTIHAFPTWSEAIRLACWQLAD